ncbi:MAG TPA: HD domain-containing protein [Candidatus Methylomirabilis sp.]|nr:HD domain-containing protein [Candidatus Methylomirabilis sp.]
MAEQRVAVKDLKLNEPVTSFFQVRNPQRRLRKTGEPFLTLVLADGTGELPAVLWEDVEGVGEQIREGDLVKVQGMVGSYQGELQLTIQRLRVARDGEAALADFLPTTEADVTWMLAFLHETIHGFTNEPLKRLLTRIFEDEGFRGAFAAAPAAKELHHAYLGGLLEHTVSVVKLCDAIAAHYGGTVDRDLLLASAILHDVGKIYELTWERGFDYSDAGRLLGHITQGVLFVEEQIEQIPEFPPGLRMELLHNILSHHGEYEWGSPRRPKTVEAMILHAVENLDGKINLFLKLATHHPDPYREGWTVFHRSFERPLFFGEPDASLETPTP